jgi:hypothetical protein
LPVPADSLPLDEPLDRRVTIGLAKIGIAPKQAWAEAFWKSCPEFRSAAIGEWLHRHQLAPWPERKPPTFTVRRLSANRFAVSAADR